ncbi:peptidyl-prolyl cis-trans isomerase [Desulfoluna butyratoxydans]|nr:peptidylprolyl isomerase [Desulfoluna butyratoxydans]
MLGDEGRRKVLESLVASRAIAMASEKELGAEALAELEKKVVVYREQLLVKSYLASHANPQPVTAEMVKAYYESNPERFGARTTVVYEMVSTEHALEGDGRNRVMEALGKIGNEDAWDESVAELREQRLPVFYKKGRVAKEMMNPRLFALISSTQEGQTSNLTFIEGVPYLIRVIKREHVPPRPLQEVSASIRKSLVPVQLKKDVKKVAGSAIAASDVEYL